MGSINVDDQQTKAQRGLIELARDNGKGRYVDNHPISKKHHEMACESMPGGNTRSVLHVSPFPLTIQSAESCFVTTADGHRYIDFLGEYTAGLFGHNDPTIRAAIDQALDHGWVYGGPSLMEQKLAQVICTRFPAIELVRFVNSGTEANMMALATAVAFTRKKGIIMFNGAYHGGTISGKTDSNKVDVNLPHQFIIAKYNDEDEIQSLVEHHKDELAAIIVEPMMGSGGCISAKPEFLRCLRELTTRHNIILIFDEVMTSRLSYHGLGSQHGVTPDLMTIGKWVGGGLAFGAFGGRKDLMQMYDPRTGELQHPGTFNNNIITMTASVAACELFNEDRVEKLHELGEYMRLSLEEVFGRYSIAGVLPIAPLSDDEHKSDYTARPPKMYVSGIGSLMNIHFGGPDRDVLRELYYHYLLENGIYIAQRGLVALSLEIDQSYVDKFVEATNKFCCEWKSWLQW